MMNSPTSSSYQVQPSVSCYCSQVSSSSSSSSSSSYSITKNHHLIKLNRPSHAEEGTLPMQFCPNASVFPLSAMQPDHFNLQLPSYIQNLFKILSICFWKYILNIYIDFCQHYCNLIKMCLIFCAMHLSVSSKLELIDWLKFSSSSMKFSSLLHCDN